MSQPATKTVALVGAGPIGLELAVGLQEQAVDYIHLDAGQVGQTMTWFPREMDFFSSPDRLAIAGIPLRTLHQRKASREEYLAYLRSIAERFELPIRCHERLHALRKVDGLFELETRSLAGEHLYRAHNVVLAIGNMHRPRRLDIPGEDLPHVSHYFDEAHPYFRKELLIVGGRNSAVEAALRCYHAGARVTISYRRAAFYERLKPWLRPTLEGCLENGSIRFYPRTEPIAITPPTVQLRDLDEGEALIEPHADFVLLLTGYAMDTSLIERMGVPLIGANRAPQLDPDTMETPVPGLYMAGTAASGTQQRVRVFVENCHSHVVRILRAITGQSPRRINELGFRLLSKSAKLLDPES